MIAGYCSRDAYGHPVCRYCQDSPMRVRGGEIFPDHPQAATMHYLRCRPCNAYVRCLNGTWEPLGELGDPSVRRARKSAHDAVESLLRRALSSSSWPEEVARAAIQSWLVAEGASAKALAGLEIIECDRIIRLCATPSPALGVHVYKVSAPLRTKGSKKNRRSS